MSRLITPYRILPANLPAGFQVKAQFVFTSHGPDPKAKLISAGQYSLGADSDWSADDHDLVIQCQLEHVCPLAILFGDEGVAAQDAELAIALEWTSADSGWRKLSPPLCLTREQCEQTGVARRLLLPIERGTMRGSGFLALMLMLRQPGNVGSNPAFAQVAGARLGELAERVEVVIDGDGSMFPVLEEARTSAGALWELRANWIDAFEEPFSSEYIALLLNRDHELYSALYERKPETGGQTPLMRQVLSSWIALFVYKVKDEIGDELEVLVGRPALTDELGSIADAAAAFVRVGSLDTTSPEKLFASVQCWLDRRVETVESGQ
ncbi:hypothetical protein KS461_12430 [Pseudomonas chlororaphis]|uniref:hypothetical protein n=1 Tax=Pseudomonas chlororaphis TaxID=587753 RepID=UPI00215B2721|nr:hypothetical protein [Pseudomonas chlororaphis]UVE48044.1 hypothetical protein KS461_12430 [Pseudomonas chlororaphis]